ncbi:MAG: hypothetical protein AB7V16_07295 [Vulcanibacillus sp.]
MIKLKEGQKIIDTDGNTYFVENGDYIKENTGENSMKKLDTKKEKSKKVEIVLTKPYLIEGKIAPKGTKILVESSDIYDDFSTPSNIADASVPNTSDDIYTMRRMARMRKMGMDDETFEPEMMKRMDDVEEQEDEEMVKMKKFSRMYKMFKAMDAEDKEDEIEENDDEELYDDEEIMAMRRMARMRRMKALRRMKKDDKKEEKDEDEDEDKEKEDK